ncbi:MAG: hypothetical protein AAB916_01525 [Patescibacteria group bacterium]
MNQKGSTNIILIVVAIVVVAIGGYFILSKKSVTPTVQPAPQADQGGQQVTPPPKTSHSKPTTGKGGGGPVFTPSSLYEFPTLESIRTESKNWKDFVSAKYGFRFKHPTEYRTGGLKEGDNLFDTPLLKSSWLTLAASLVLSKDADPNREGAQNILLRVFSNSRRLSIKEWLMTDEAIKQVGKNLDESGQSSSFLELTTIEVSGEKVFIFNNIPGCKNEGVTCNRSYFSHGNYIFEFQALITGPEHDKRENTANKILLTFDFIP